MNQRALDFIRDTLKDKYCYEFEWMGRPIIQFPQDIIALQEIIWKVKPDYVIETGVAHGGGLVMYASILECLGRGRVLGIDIDPREHNMKALEKHPLRHMIDVVKGDSVDGKVIEAVKDYIGYVPNPTVLVILDSLHTHAHVLKELELYSPLVSVGSYLVAMDTIIEYLPPSSFPDRPWDVGNNPAIAVRQFLREHPEFEIDRSIEERLMITSSPGGYLRRIA